MAITNLGALPAAARHHHQSALIMPPEDNQQQSSITYAELDAQADALGRGLRARGFQHGERIALLGRNSIEFVVCLLAILRAGLVAVPVNVKLATDTLEKILDDCDAGMVFGDADQLARLNSGRVRQCFTALAAESQAGELPPFLPQPDDLAMLLYTSGSTGMPKGVRLTHASQRWVVETRLAARELNDERVLIAAPLYHMNALALILLTLASTVTAVLLPQFQAQAYIRAIARYRCSWLTAVPPMIAMMMQEHATLAENDLSSVRVVRMGSAPINTRLFTQIHQLWPQARIIHAYGTTEGGPVVFGSHPQGIPTPLTSPGYPHPQVAVRLRDDDGRLSERGVLEIRSPALMQGYHQRPDVATPFTADGYYITGDIFERDQVGFYTFVGRRDDMFVCGGENIYPGEVEKLLELHPEVLQACVVPISDEIKGSKPVAWVIPQAGTDPHPAALKRWVLERGPAWLHPRQIWLISQFPLASTHKVDRQALRLAAEQQMTEINRQEGQA